jgi:hypothetical protein
MESKMMRESVWANISKYLFKYLVEMLFLTFFHVLLSIDNILFLTYLACHFIDYYAVTALIIEDALAIISFTLSNSFSSMWCSVSWHNFYCEVWMDPIHSPQWCRLLSSSSACLLLVFVPEWMQWDHASLIGNWSSLYETLKYSFLYGPVDVVCH